MWEREIFENLILRVLIVLRYEKIQAVSTMIVKNYSKTYVITRKS
jgi:hypothetical protein